MVEYMMIIIIVVKNCKCEVKQNACSEVHFA